MRGVSDTRRLLLVNGPNLNLLGVREPAVYGEETLADVVRLVEETAAGLGFEVEAVQSNHEGVLIDALHAARETCEGVVINPGGLTHTSVVLRDALAAVALPVAEVHISDTAAREEFRHFSYVSDLAAVVVVGQGVPGYADAVRQLVDHLDTPLPVEMPEDDASEDLPDPTDDDPTDDDQSDPTDQPGGTP